MHEFKTCEIALLRCSGSTVWTAASTVRGMQAHLDNSTQEARQATAPNSVDCPRARARGRFHVDAAVLQVLRRRAARVSLSLSAGFTAVCSPARATEDSGRTAHSVSRWPLVRVRCDSMGLVPDRSQVLSRKHRHVPGSLAAARQGRSLSVASSICRDPHSSGPTNTGDGRRQPPWNATDRSRPSVASAAVPLPPAAQAAGPTTRSSLHPSRRRSERRDQPPRTAWPTAACWGTVNPCATSP
jgi:hypothetical protein